MADLVGPIQHKRGTTAQWAASQIPLRDGELGIDSTLRRMKVGDGSTLWAGLPWASTSAADIARLEAAATALEGASAPTDAAMTTIQANPNSAFAQAQKATFVSLDIAPLAPASHRSWPRMTVVSGLSGSSDGWFASGGNDNDQTDYVLGDRSLSLVTDGAGGYGRYFKKALSLNMTGKGLVIWVKLVNGANLQYLSVDLANETGMTNRVRASIPTPGLSGKSTLFDNEWVPLFIPASQFAPAAGSPNIATLTYIQIIPADFGGGKTATVKVGGVATYDEGIPRYPSGVVSFSFDDSYAAAFTIGVPKLAQYGFPATVYPIIENLGLANRLTVAQLKKMQNSYGWEIGTHCYTQAQHATMVGGDPVALNKMLLDCRTWQAQNGLSSSSFAYPIGPFDAQAIELVRRHYAYARTNDANPYSPYVPFPLTAPALALGSTTTLAQAKAAVDRTVVAKAGLHFVLHDITDTVGPNNWSAADFRALVDYVAASGAAVRLPIDVMRGL